MQENQKQFDASLGMHEGYAERIPIGTSSESS